MALIIYEVVSGGTKKHHPTGGEDWSVLVAAHSPAEARDIACHETEIDRPWAIYEWGTDARINAKPVFLRGPFENCPAVCRGWKMFEEDLSDDSESPRIVESPKPPEGQRALASKICEFTCSQCGKTTIGNVFFTITASGYMNKGKTGSGRGYSSADWVKLSLWHIADYEKRRSPELKLSAGETANVACCSAACLKDFLGAAVDKLVRCSTQF